MPASELNDSPSSAVEDEGAVEAEELEEVTERAILCFVPADEDEQPPSQTTADTTPCHWRPPPVEPTVAAVLPASLPHVTTLLQQCDDDAAKLGRILRRTFPSAWAETRRQHAGAGDDWWPSADLQAAAQGEDQLANVETPVVGREKERLEFLRGIEEWLSLIEKTRRDADTAQAEADRAFCGDMQATDLVAEVARTREVAAGLQELHNEVQTARRGYAALVDELHQELHEADVLSAEKLAEFDALNPSLVWVRAETVRKKEELARQEAQHEALMEQLAGWSELADKSSREVVEVGLVDRVEEKLRLRREAVEREEADLKERMIVATERTLVHKANAQEQREQIEVERSHLSQLRAEHRKLARERQEARERSYRLSLQCQKLQKKISREAGVRGQREQEDQEAEAKALEKQIENVEADMVDHKKAIRRLELEMERARKTIPNVEPAQLKLLAARVECEGRDRDIAEKEKAIQAKQLQENAWSLELRRVEKQLAQAREATKQAAADAAAKRTELLEEKKEASFARDLARGEARVEAEAQRAAAAQLADSQQQQRRLEARLAKIEGINKSKNVKQELQDTLQACDGEAERLAGLRVEVARREVEVEALKRACATMTEKGKRARDSSRRRIGGSSDEKIGKLKEELAEAKGELKALVDEHNASKAALGEAEAKEAELQQKKVEMEEALKVAQKQQKIAEKQSLAHDAKLERSRMMQARALKKVEMTPELKEQLEHVERRAFNDALEQLLKSTYADNLEMLKEVFIRNGLKWP